MPYSTCIVVFGISIFVLIGGILLYRHRQVIKTRNNLNRKAMNIYIPNFVSSIFIKTDMDTPIRQRIHCSGMYEMLKNRKDVLGNTETD